MTKNIIFDLGGVILNIDFNKAAIAFKELGINNFEDLYSRATQSKLFVNFEKGLISEEQFYDEIRSLSEINISNDEIKGAWNELILDYPPKRLELLKKLKENYNCCLLSNTNKIHYDCYQKDLRDNHNIDGLESLFEKAYFSQDLKQRKPDLGIFQHVLTDQKIKPKETLFIDDTMENINAAKEMGMHTLYIDVAMNDDILNYFTEGKITNNKPKIDTEYTSATNLFSDKNTDLWTKDDAPILVGVGIRNPENLGGLIRLAGTIGCSKVIFADVDKDHKVSKIKKTATNGFKKVEWGFSSLENWTDKIPDDYTIIAMETTPDAKMIYDVQFPKKVAIVVGDESYGIYLDSLKKCHSQLYIPMNGPVKSLNVVQAAGVALYELLRQKMML